MATPTGNCAEDTTSDEIVQRRNGEPKTSPGRTLELQTLECSSCPPDNSICNDGFSTPKSAQHRVSHCSECPPPPRKRRVKPHCPAVPFTGIFIPHDYLEAINFPY
eukprot:Gb_04324 [translate_table: standard]